MAEMENVKVTELDIATESNNADILMVLQEGTNKKMSKEVFLADINTELEDVIKFRGTLDELNLNDVKEPGIYLQNGNANATTARNYPTASAGFLKVSANTPYKSWVLQEYTEYITGITHTRNFNSNSWRAWGKAGQVNATTGVEIATNESIDGKQVYKKIINCGALPNNTSKLIPHGLTNVTFRKIEGITGPSAYILPIPHMSVAAGMAVIINGANIEIITTNDRSGYTGTVTLEYTKN